MTVSFAFNRIGSIYKVFLLKACMLFLPEATTSNRIGRISQNPIHSRLSTNTNQGGGRRYQGNEYTWKNKNYTKQGGIGERQKQSRFKLFLIKKN